MSKNEKVSLSVIRRLPRYYRFLAELLQQNKVRISSRELSEIMGLTASQIRQDLNCFGGFGQQGYGYNVQQLYSEIASILGVEKSLPTILIGAGNLGRAIATHMSFESKGFQLTAIFDNKKSVIGTKIRDLTILDASLLEEYCRENKPQAAVLCIPKESSRKIAEQLIALGIKGFWNFSHYDLTVNNEDISVENVHLGDSLMTLCYKINNRQDNKGPL